MVVPTLTFLEVVESEVVLIKGGRHPLQQLVVDTYIPNDVALGHNGVKAAVITGPNFSGKKLSSQYYQIT
jgi:DNA mismatch repair ATPase MutS